LDAQMDACSHFVEMVFATLRVSMPLVRGTMAIADLQDVAICARLNGSVIVYATRHV